DRDFTPDIHAAHVFVGIFGPGIVSGFTRPRNGVEDPRKLAGPDIECADVTGRCEVTLAREASYDDQVLEDSARSPRSERDRSAINTRLQIQFPVIGEAIDQVAGCGVDGVHEAASVYKNPTVGMIGAFPVIGSAAANATGSAALTEFVLPKFFSRGSVQRNQRALFS